MTLHEDRVDPSHGQRRDLAMDPDLVDEWGAFPAVVDGAALAMARIQEQHEKDAYPQANRFLVGLNAGWEERKAAKVRARMEKALEEAATSEG